MSIAVQRVVSLCVLVSLFMLVFIPGLSRAVEPASGQSHSLPQAANPTDILGLFDGTFSSGNRYETYAYPGTVHQPAAVLSKTQLVIPAGFNDSLELDLTLTSFHYTGANASIAVRPLTAGGTAPWSQAQPILQAASSTNTISGLRATVGWNIPITTPMEIELRCDGYGWTGGLNASGQTCASSTICPPGRRGRHPLCPQPA
jgi:hypothetical protein